MTMKNIIAILFVVSLILISCGGTPKEESEHDSVDSAEVYKKYDSLYWMGTYISIEDCNDCVRIEKRLTLNDDYSFELRVEYIGSDKPNIERYEGFFSLDRRTKAILLYQKDGEDLIKSVYNLKDNSFVSDEDNEIVYRKLFSNNLTDENWYLQFISGKPVSGIRIQRLKSAFIKFNPDGMVSGQTRCNNFNGRFEVGEDGLVKISDLIMTKMACPESELEKEYIDVLSQKFNYRIEIDTLEFMNADDVIIAKFVK